MKAIMKNLKDGILNKLWANVTMYCPSCGSTYSANSGDYWYIEDKNHKFKCCGQTMELVRPKLTHQSVK